MGNTNRIGVIVGTLLLIIGMTCGYLWHADPQSGRLAYRFHARVNYWLGKQKSPDKITHPLHYSGVWKNWYIDGKRSEATYQDGTLKGKILNWDENGNLTRDGYFEEENYLWREWKNGKLVLNGIIYDRQYWYGIFEKLEEPDRLRDIIVYYLDYKEVSKEEYEQWEKESGGIDKILAEHPEIKR